MSELTAADCQHLISEVALRKVEGSYLVECLRCASPMGMVSTPREFQALRRAVLALGRRSRQESPGYNLG